jgi:hypothetical protein
MAALQQYSSSTLADSSSTADGWSTKAGDLLSTVDDLFATAELPAADWSRRVSSWMSAALLLAEGQLAARCWVKLVLAASLVAIEPECPVRALFAGLWNRSSCHFPWSRRSNRHRRQSFAPKLSSSRRLLKMPQRFS